MPHLYTLRMGREMVPETLETSNHLASLIAREDFIGLSRHESLVSCIFTVYSYFPAAPGTFSQSLTLQTPFQSAAFTLATCCLGLHRVYLSSRYLLSACNRYPCTLLPRRADDMTVVAKSQGS